MPRTVPLPIAPVSAPLSGSDAPTGTVLLHPVPRPRRAVRPALSRIPLAGKLVGANALVARVPESPSADPTVARVGRTFNLVLDGLAGDRARLRALAAEAFRAGDAERARLGRELHDSAAQTLAAALYQVSAVRSALADGSADRRALDAALAAAIRLATDALDEVRVLAQDAYPRVLDDLGLPAALRALRALRALAHRAAPPDPVLPNPLVTVEADPLPADALAHGVAGPSFGA